MLKCCSKILFSAFYTICFLPIYSAQSQATLLTPRNYPKGYFIWPVDARIGIAANFGELRPNHFHMGLDCRTDQRENRRVFAAADGYVSRIKIEPWGFGRAISINHPNGLTTLYAHLNEFDPRIEAYVKSKQYEQKSWKITIDIPEGILPVKQGDFIAFSGNTGGSMGPHVHFEVRDTKTDKVLNPLLMGFPIPDRIPPSILRLAVYDRRLSTYEQTPHVYSLKFTHGKYQTNPALIKVSTDKVSFAITAFDKYTGSTNRNGIYEAELLVDDQPVSAFQIDSISYDETRYLNAHIDYKTRANGGPYLQHLSRLPGYINSIYKTTSGDGVIELNDTRVHQIKIRVMDTQGNESSLVFNIQRSATLSKTVDNQGLLFLPNQVNVFENEHAIVYLPENAIYDSFYFHYSKTGTSSQPIYQLHTATVPVQVYFPVMIRSDAAFPDTGKVVMKRFYKNKKDFKKADYTQGWYRASFREFGNFQLLYDDQPPTLTAVGFHNGMNVAKLHSIRFRATDNMEEIGSFEAYLDGNWIRFSNDKTRDFIYVFDEKCSAGEHELRIVVKDLVGNATERTYRFTR